MHKYSFILVLIALSIWLSSCKATHDEHSETEATDLTINKHDKNGVPTGLWERRDDHGDLLERIVYTPEYDTENDDVILNAEIELFDRGELNMKFTSFKLYNQKTNFVVDDFKGFVHDEKTGIQGQFTREGYALSLIHI